MTKPKYYLASLALAAIGVAACGSAQAEEPVATTTTTTEVEPTVEQLLRIGWFNLDPDAAEGLCSAYEKYGPTENFWLAWDQIVVVVFPAAIGIRLVGADHGEVEAFLKETC